MLILGLLGMYFDAAVVFVTKSLLFFRLAVAILWAFAVSIFSEGLEGLFRGIRHTDRFWWYLVVFRKIRHHNQDGSKDPLVFVGHTERAL